MLQEINKKYRKTVMTLSGLVIAILSAILYYAYLDAVILTKVQFNEQQTLLASQSSRAIENNIEILVRELQMLAEHPAIKHYDISKKTEILTTTFEYVKKFMVNDIGLLDSAGIARIAFAARQLEGRDFSFRKYFQKARELKASLPTYELIEFKGVDHGAMGVIIAMPVFPRPEEFGGVILFTLKISELIQGLVPPHHGDSIFWVVDSSGQVLFHPAYRAGTVIGSLADTDDSFRVFLKKIMKGQPVKAEYLSPARIKTIASSYPVQVALDTWTLVVATPEKTISKLLGPFSNKYFLMIFLIVFLAISAGITVIFINIDLRDEIDERKLAEEKSKNQSRFLNTVIESIPYPFYVINAGDHTITHANSRAAVVGKWQGKTCYALTHGRKTPCNGEEHTCPLIEVKKQRKPVVVEHIHNDLEGRKRLYEVHGYPIFNDDGKVVEMIELSIDISERKKVEKEREELIIKLQSALDEIKTLRGILPVCSYCKNIRDDKGYWSRIEAYISEHSEAQFSHSICPKCLKKKHPKVYESLVSGGKIQEK